MVEGEEVHEGRNRAAGSGGMVPGGLDREHPDGRTAEDLRESYPGHHQPHDPERTHPGDRAR
jgi:hypothetical protein